MLPPRDDIEYCSTKTYTHAIGLSCCFRQWRAESHCRFLHGYALEVKLTFSCTELDDRNWTVDFGSLKSFKGWLEDTFDHKLLVAEDDPMLKLFQFMESGSEEWSPGFKVNWGMGFNKIADVVVVKATGCEAFARMIFEYGEQWLIDNGYTYHQEERCQRVFLEEVEVKEHAANSAICRRRRA
jgi:6-pyruvoyltetrahydropterin/6-carboxytetrahydropterin synthase